MASKEEQEIVIRELAGTHRPVVVDIGSFDGAEYDWMQAAFNPVGWYVAVEADPRAPILVNAICKPHMIIMYAAISATDGDALLYPSDNQTGQAKASSSIHKPTGHLTHFPWCTFHKPIKVRAMRLDKLVADLALPIIDLLWVDIQGAERDMIAGGYEALKRTRYLMIEAESEELYEGQALKPELLSLLPDFEVIHDFGYNVFLKRRIE